MNLSLTFSSYHETGHAIVQLVNRDKAGMSHHGIKAIEISEGGGRILIPDACTSKDIYKAVSSNIPDIEKRRALHYAESKIIFFMAGLAAEFLMMEDEKLEVMPVLKRFYRCDANREKGSDFAKAIDLNVALGRQKPEDGVAPLKDYFLKALKILREYNRDPRRGLLNWVADQIGGGGIIVGERLEELITGMREYMDNNKS